MTLSGTVLISTHHLESAGPLRTAFEREGYEVDFMPGVEHLDLTDDPALLVLTGEGDADDWLRAGRDRLDVPVFLALPAGVREGRGKARGFDAVFDSDAGADEVALQGHRAIERRRLQGSTGIIGASESMVEVLERLVQIAPVPSTVLITGESGTGKELVARGIHDLSGRRTRAFLAVNVAALSETLLESELFGHEKGSFTGAIDSRRGFFELAHRGTLFLDEIGEMPLSTQTKLLRVLEQREFMRVGGEKSIQVDVRIIAATNRDLRELVVTGEFRRDLYYRLNILNIELPPLRDRRDDIPVLIHHFVEELSRRMDRPFPGISDQAMEILVNYDWPGNVRELRNLVESMVVLSPGREIRPDDIPREIRIPRGMNRLLPVPVGGMPQVPVSAGTTETGDPRGEEGRERGGADPGLRPQLEFVFRTLVDLKMDVDQLRREFEVYREEVDDRLDAGDAGGWVLSTPMPGVEVGARVGAPGPQGSESPGVPAEGPSNETLQPDDQEGLDGPGDIDAPVVFRPGMTMDDLEEEAIRVVLRETGGNRRKAAESLGIGERTLYRKIRKYGIEV